MDSLSTHVADDRIFIVEDDAAVRDSLRLLLESHGMDVQDFGSVEDFADASRPRPHGCLILDHNLPGESGMEFLASRAAVPDGLAVILLTGRGDREMRNRALALGACAYLEKPVDSAVLMDAIERALARIRPALSVDADQ